MMRERVSGGRSQANDEEWASEAMLRPNDERAGERPISIYPRIVAANYVAVS